MQAPATFANEATVRAFFETLDRECSSYCLLGGYEGLPATIHSDVDFMVGHEDFEKLPQILLPLAQKCGFRLIQAFQHETTARYYILGESRPSKVSYLHPDSCSDYRRHNRTWLRAETVLARRRKHPDGYWIPGATDAFVYYLIKRVDKQKLEAQHARQLSHLFSEDPQGCTEALLQRFAPSSAQAIVDAARSGNWQPIVNAIGTLDHELLASTNTDTLHAKFHEWVRRFRRVLRPTGLCVAIMGPDGSGKSSVIAQYFSSLEPAFRRTARFHLRPHLLRSSKSGTGVNTDPHGQTPRGALVSTVKLFYLLADYVLGYSLRVRPQAVRSTLVVFDRYYHDLLIDPLRFRYSGPRWLARVVARLIPMPDLMLILDAPAEVLQARKQEVPMEESARQAKAFQELAHSASVRGRAVVIDASQPLEQVVHECVDVTMALLAKRTAKRLHLAS